MWDGARAMHRRMEDVTLLRIAGSAWAAWTSLDEVPNTRSTLKEQNMVIMITVSRGLEDTRP